MFGKLFPLHVSFLKVDLQRTFTFRNSKQTYNGIPIIAANMDTTGTFEMAQVLSKVSASLNKAQ
uniref:IMP dehydrogenase/GMP reductase domain-containing protein n=1 Tax=Sinocyclocheilus anshuiensis TaxID=1608454 RepID=A0A671MJN7_9TELE